ncbi:Mobile element protein [Sphingobacterium sp. JB170]|nr:Mobile element protein [Sphingobacterium sp. JB170]
MINGNYAKAFCGFKTRMLSKISAVTLIQDMSKFLSERNIKNIKIQII